MIDCVNDADGCNGDSSFAALEFSAKAGTVSDNNYPYKAEDTGTCLRKTHINFKNKGVARTTRGDCNSLKNAL
jgi:hypothetical protein